MKIIRKPTSEELKDFQEAKPWKKTNEMPQDRFIKFLWKEEKRYGALRIPFCRRCARLDFDDALTQYMKEYRRKNPMQTIGAIASNRDAALRDELQRQTIVQALGFEDLSKYVGEEQFVLLSETPAKEQHVVDGRKMKVEVGTYLNFQCKQRGCRHTITMTTKEYEDRKPKPEEEVPQEVKGSKKVEKPKKE